MSHCLLVIAVCWTEVQLQVKRNQTENGSTETSDHLQHLTEYVCSFCLPAAAMLLLLLMSTGSVSFASYEDSAAHRFVVRLET